MTLAEIKKNIRLIGGFDESVIPDADLDSFLAMVEEEYLNLHDRLQIELTGTDRDILAQTDTIIPYPLFFTYRTAYLLSVREATDNGNRLEGLYMNELNNMRKEIMYGKE